MEFGIKNDFEKWVIADVEEQLCNGFWKQQIGTIVISFVDSVAFHVLQISRRVKRYTVFSFHFQFTSNFLT